jgi:hypothetical protein
MEMIAMAASRQKPDPRRAPLPFALQLRMSDRTYRALALIADRRDVSIASVARGFIDDRLRDYRDEKRGLDLLEAMEVDPDVADELLERADLVEDASA